MNRDAARAHEIAAAIRDARSAFVDACATDDTTIVSLCCAYREAIKSSTGEAIRTLRLLPCVEAMPAAGGKVRSRRAMAAAGLSEDVSLGEITDDQWRRLADEVHGEPS